MEIPSASALMQSIRELPAGARLLDRLGDGSGVYLVGGAVRDLLRGEEPVDFDLVVDGNANALPQRLGSARTHSRFRTSTVVLDGFTYDIARARTETYAHPGALPEVRPASLQRDLLRRDFTINALAIALGGSEPGSLHQAPRALEDLCARLVRVFHARSFIDDPTRLLRLVRYASRLDDFEIEAETLALARSAVADGALRTVSGSRIGAELRMLAREPDPVAAFELLAALGFDVALAPGLGIRDPAVARRALALLPPDGRADLTVLALAAQHVPGHALAGLLGPLEFVAGDRDAIIAGAVRAEGLARALEKAASPSAMAHAVGGTGPEVVAIAGALGPEAKGREWLERLRHMKLAIDGEDLRAMGVEQGPAIGRGLRAALDAKIDGRVSGREQELAEALRAAARSG